MKKYLTYFGSFPPKTFPDPCNFSKMLSHIHGYKFKTISLNTMLMKQIKREAILASKLLFNWFLL